MTITRSTQLSQGNIMTETLASNSAVQCDYDTVYQVTMLPTATTCKIVQCHKIYNDNNSMSQTVARIK